MSGPRARLMSTFTNCGYGDAPLPRLIHTRESLPLRRRGGTDRPSLSLHTPWLNTVNGAAVENTASLNRCDRIAGVNLQEPLPSFRLFPSGAYIQALCSLPR